MLNPNFHHFPELNPMKITSKFINAFVTLSHKSWLLSQLYSKTSPIIFPIFRYLYNYNGWFDSSDPSFILAQHGPPLHFASGRPLVMVPVLSNTAQFNAETFSQTVASCDFVNLGDFLVGFHRLK
jgi:hypothetical protein